jgi:hypothetical protein
MADLRSRFIEDYAGGLLNVSRQELASNGEVLSQDGFLTDSTAYVEDGVGTKSGLRLGVGIAETVDPTTQTGIVNVRYADRTYTKIRDTKIFTTAMASAQAALAESVAESLGNIESAIDYLEIFDSQIDTRLSVAEADLPTISGLVSQNTNDIIGIKQQLDNIQSIIAPEVSVNNSQSTNIKLGEFALSSLVNGASNVAIGFYSLGNLYSGNNNIAVGHQAGTNSLEGSNNILIGVDARTTRDNASNEIILGSRVHKYLWSNTDIYTPANVSAAGDSSVELDLDSTDFIEFIKKLKFSRFTQTQSSSHVVIDPFSLKQAEDSISNKGYVHLESNSVSNGKLVPVALAGISKIVDLLQDLGTDFDRKFVPIGGIIMWSGNINSLSQDWALCDGRLVNGIFTPDLRNKFIIGAGGDFEIGARKDTGPTVPTHNHRAIPTFPGMTESFIAPDRLDNWSIPNTTNISQQSGIMLKDSDQRDSGNEIFGPVDYALNEINTTTDGTQGAETYPPFYALAYIMRIA